AGLKGRQLPSVVFDVIKIEFAFELVKYLVAWIDMKILAPVGTAGHEGDEVRVLPNHPALVPVPAVLIDPFLQIESLQVRMHRTSIYDEDYRIAARPESS